MMRVRLLLLIVMIVTSGVSGCARFLNGSRETLVNELLPPLKVGNNSQAFELYFVRLPFGQEGLETDIWNEVDEQQLPLAQRRVWEANGIRIGFVGGQLPPHLGQLIQPKPSGENSAAPALSDDPRPNVTRRLIHTRSGNRNEIVLMGQATTVSLLMCDEGHVTGKNFDNAQGQFAFKSTPAADGRAKLEFVPELQYGEARTRYTGEDGMMRLDTSRPKQVFEKLTIESALAEGQLLVFGNLVGRGSTLGHYLFTEERDGKRERKLLLVRMVRGQNDDLFTTDTSAAKDKE